jgi:hypothetical protein
MAVTMTGGPRRRGSQEGLSTEDVRALFKLMTQAVYAGDEDERGDLAFTGRLLATWFEAYSEHLIKLMENWPELSEALQGKDANVRARVLHERLRRSGTIRPLIDLRGRPMRIVPDDQADVARSLIKGKGMEI